MSRIIKIRNVNGCNYIDRNQSNSKKKVIQKIVILKIKFCAELKAKGLLSNKMQQFIPIYNALCILSIFHDRNQKI